MYTAKNNRYEQITYKRCGKSGVKLPQISLGLWQNFGLEKSIEEQQEIIFCAFDHGITHFDLANNYGPVYGSAETNLGRLKKQDK